MLVIGVMNVTWVMFYMAAALVGLGLGMLLGAPLRYVMLNEAPVEDRCQPGGALTLHLQRTACWRRSRRRRCGLPGGGVVGYQGSYLAVGAAAVILAFLALALKSHAAEMATVRRNEQAGKAQPA